MRRTLVHRHLQLPRVYARRAGKRRGQRAMLAAKRDSRGRPRSRLGRGGVRPTLGRSWLARTRSSSRGRIGHACRLRLRSIAASHRSGGHGQQQQALLSSHARVDRTAVHPVARNPQPEPQLCRRKLARAPDNTKKRQQPGRRGGTPQVTAGRKRTHVVCHGTVTVKSAF
jgi:hypothetical protein